MLNSSDGRWTQTTARRSNRLHRMTAGHDCWTSWTWPSLTFSWVSMTILWWSLASFQKSIVGETLLYTYCTHTSYNYRHICALCDPSWLNCLLVSQHRKHGSPPLWDVWKVWKWDLHYPPGQRQRVRHRIVTQEAEIKRLSDWLSFRDVLLSLFHLMDLL